MHSQLLACCSSLCPLKLVVGQTECKYSETMWQLELPLIANYSCHKGLVFQDKCGLVQSAMPFKQCGPVHLVSQGEDNFTLMGVLMHVAYGKSCVGLHINPHIESDPNKKRVGGIS